MSHAVDLVCMTGWKKKLQKTDELTSGKSPKVYLCAAASCSVEDDVDSWLKNEHQMKFITFELVENGPEFSDVCGEGDISVEDDDFLQVGRQRLC